MIFVKSDETGKVQMVHYMPLDAVYGLGKTEEELVLEGCLVDSMPDEPIPVEGKCPVLYFEQSTNTLYFEMEDIPPVLLTPEQQEVVDLKQQIADLNIAMAEIMGVM